MILEFRISAEMIIDYHVYQTRSLSLSYRTVHMWWYNAPYAALHQYACVVKVWKELRVSEICGNIYMLTSPSSLRFNHIRNVEV